MLYHLWRAVNGHLREWGELDELDQRLAQVYHFLAAKITQSPATDRPGQRLDSTQAPERCDICDAPMHFKSIRSAECPRGHQFGEFWLGTFEPFGH